MALVGLIVFVAFITPILPAQSPEAQKYARVAGSPDGSFFYTSSDLYRMAEAYGQTGREAYVRASFTFDVIWSLAYGFFLATAISWVFGKMFPSPSRWRWMNLAPVLGVSFDILENLAASVVMSRYPARTPIIDSMTPIFTMVKWTFITGSFAILLVGIVVGLMQKLKRFNNPN